MTDAATMNRVEARDEAAHALAAAYLSNEAAQAAAAATKELLREAEYEARQHMVTTRPVTVRKDDVLVTITKIDYRHFNYIISEEV